MWLNGYAILLGIDPLPADRIWKGAARSAAWSAPGEGSPKSSLQLDSFRLWITQLPDELAGVLLSNVHFMQILRQGVGKPGVVESVAASDDFGFEFRALIVLGP